MLQVEDSIKEILNDVVSSYETRIKLQNLQSIFNNTFQIIKDFQNSAINTKYEIDKTNIELRENLAKKQSLRKKDFDNMMDGFLSSYEEKEENEIKNLLNIYFKEQEEIGHTLMENLIKVKESIAKNDVNQVREFYGVIKKIVINQEERKNEVIFKLKEFQKEQQEVMKGLREILAKGEELRIRDFKEMLDGFRKQKADRKAEIEKRKNEVRDMLFEFRENRFPIEIFGITRCNPDKNIRNKRVKREG